MRESRLTDFDRHLISEGTHYRGYEKLGAHPMAKDGCQGTSFAVWAPEAARVSVMGDFNQWDPDSCPMSPAPGSGIWEVFVPEVSVGTLYKYHIVSKHKGYSADKADPYAFASEVRPQTASKVYDLSGYEWGDAEWMATRHQRNALDSPVSIYEVHLGSWRRAENNRWLTYREAAQQLSEYCLHMGFTHVEFLPLAEHPFDGSWGYQTIGYFSPTSRFGTPKDLMFLIDTLHQHGIGVILDWVPAHFPRDVHGLGFFDGSHLYEHADPRQGMHPDWDTFVFNYGQKEVQSFLLSNALFWLERYHTDGLRVDAVSSMLYLNFGRSPGEWVPNRFGGHENLEAIEFLRRFNETVYREHPDTMTVAEESTAWPMVSRPVYLGGLGFGLKWNMGWMHDMLDYMALDPLYRGYHQNRLTFSTHYAFQENFVLPFSHDEVVHGKGSMIGRMPGNDWQKFANLRLLYGFMFGHPGKKLLFMGNEFGQWREWSHDSSLDWHLLQYQSHQGLQRWVRDLNTFYRAEAAMYQVDFTREGFRWIDCNDKDFNIISFMRYGRETGKDRLAFVCNFTPVPRFNYRVGVPEGGFWAEVLNSDASLYGGSGQGNMGGAGASPVSHHGQPYSLTLTVPPLAMVVLKPRDGA